MPPEQQNFNNPIPEVVSVQHTHLPKPKSRLLMIIFVFLVLITSVLVAGYFLTGLSIEKLKSLNFNSDGVARESTEMTKVIETPETLGFALSIPTMWEFEQAELSEPDSIANFRYSSPDSQKSFTITVIDDKDPDIMILKSWSELDIRKYDTQAKSDLVGTVGKSLGVIYTGEVGGEIYKKAYIIRGALNQIYKISVEMDPNNSWMPEFDQILSTFRFFEPKTDNYLTYKNIQFSFELTYPDTWRAREASDGVQIRNHYNPIIDPVENLIDIKISYLKDKNSKKLSITEWLKTDYNDIFVSNEKKRESINLGDEAIRSVRGTYSNTSNKTYISYLIRKGGDIVQASYAIDASSTPIYNPDKIIESMKFTQFDQAAYLEMVAGKNTKIIGEDKNNNGLWDDVESYITTNYANSEKMLAAVTQFTKAFQQTLLDSHDEKKSLENHRKTFRAWSCIRYLIGNGEKSTNEMDKSYEIITNIEAELLNTRERSEAYFKYQGQLSGHSLSTTEPLRNQCDFDPSKLPN